MKTRLILAFSLFIFCIQAVLGQVTSDFSSNIISGCSPVTVKFLDKSIGSGLRYRWSFDNGNLSTKQNPQAIFYQPGVYEVSLEVTDPSGNKDEKKVQGYITVFKNPKANLSGTPLFGCAPLVVSFSNNTILGDAPLYSSLWDFGDGNTVTASGPTHTYRTDDKFNVSLLVTDQNGCTDKISKTNYIEVDRIPDIKFIADETFNCLAPFIVNFTDQSSKTKSGDTYLWEFGDGTTSRQQNPSHTYTSTGAYTIKLTITTSNGCSSEFQRANYIKIGNIAVNFTSDKKNICAPSEVFFTNTTQPAGLKSSWDFGDGTAQANGYNVKHIYTTPGSYTVTLKVEKDAACKDQISKPNFISVIDYPTADFTYTDTTSCSIPFLFTSTSKSKNSLSDIWYLDSLEVGTSLYYANSFITFGEYNLHLVSKNQYGCKDTQSIAINIKPLDVKLESDFAGGCVPKTIAFYDQSQITEAITAKEWNFGDGNITTSLLDTVSHQYTDTGRFEVVLTITTDNGCTNSDTILIRIGQKTNPTFTINKDSFCNRNQLVLTNTTNLLYPKIESLTWHVFASDSANFDGDSLKKSIPFSQYDPEKDEHYRQYIKKKSGDYTAALITEHNMCLDTLIMPELFYIKDPLALIKIPKYNPCTLDSITFRDISKGADSIWWVIRSSTLGEIKTSDSTVTLTREVHGNSTLTLYATNYKSGCIDLDKSEVVFSEKFEPDFTLEGDPCAPANLVFNAFRLRTLTGTYKYNWTINKEYIEDHTSVFRQIVIPGDYTATLSVTQEPAGCVKEVTKPFKVTGPSVEGAVASSGSCPPLAIRLTTASDPSTYDSLYWEIEGRKIMVSSTNLINDTLFMPGRDTNNFTVVRLVGIDTNGYRGIQEFPVKVDGPASATIKIRRFIDCSSQRFILNSEVPGFDADDFSYYWDFGNGDTSTAKNAPITYANVGVYNVTLSITDTNGCVSSFTQVMDINKERVNADFDADSLETDCPPVFVQFKNLSTAISRKIVKFYWEFWDGCTSIEENPSKLYLTAGRFTVKLFVEDDYGCKDSLIYPEFVIVNGPIGSYNFDKKKGCVPLTVNFTSTTERTNFYEWDLGDGNVIENQSSYTHTYEIPGRFIPLLILNDTFGCSYTLPPIDTIYVDPYPEPDFEYTSTCVNYPISFRAKNQNALVVSEYMWEMFNPGSIDTFYGETVTYTFLDQKRPQIRLTITSRNGCKNTTLKTIELISLDAAFTSENPNTCVGTTITLKDLTISDTTLVETKWIIDGITYTDKEPSFFATKVGTVQVLLIQENVLGCKDTLDSYTLVIGDSIRPTDPEILRVTVNTNDEIQLDYKQSTNLDFKEYIIYREGTTGFNLLAAEKNNRKTSYFSNGNQTLGRSYCFKLEEKNTCGLLSDTFTDLRHCTIEIEAVGDTNKNIVTWNRYEGWNTVSVYNIYRKELNNPSVMQQIGTVSGDSNSYVDSILYCNIDYSYKVEGIEENGNLQTSWSDTANATPIWLYTPPSNTLVRATVEQDIEILIEWDSVAKSIIPISQYNLLKSWNGKNYTLLYEGSNTEFKFVDKKALVDDRSYFYQTYAIDECNDTSDIWNYGKTILLQADTSADQRPHLEWSHYMGWTEDISYYAVEIKNPDGSFMEIANFPYQDTIFTDYITNLNQRPNYCYRIVAYKEIVNNKPQIISVSNEDCSPVRSKIYYPNAFTPNADKINDFYVTPSEYIKDYEISIYNRWGEKVFQTTDISKHWDGNYLGKAAQQDAYAVIVVTTGVDLVRRVHQGTITLIR
ncbi:MAG: gliding motility-associated-like protein [Bacteroidia bacterium]